MTKYYVVESQDDPWEPSYPQFRTTSKKYAEWYCNEVNKCTDNEETYHVSKERVVPIKKPEYVLTIGFAFNIHPNFAFVYSSIEAYTDDSVGYDRILGLILCNGHGATYEECLAYATNVAEILDLGRYIAP